MVPVVIVDTIASYNLGNNRRAEGEFIIPVIAQKAILLIYFINLDVKIH